MCCQKGPKWTIIFAFAILQTIHAADDFCHSTKCNFNEIGAMQKIDKLKNLCGEICDISELKKGGQQSRSGPFFPYYWKNFDCLELFQHNWDEMGPLWPKPPKWNELPSKIQKEFTWNGILKPRDSHQNDNWEISNQTWTVKTVELMQKLFQNGKLNGNYGSEVVHKLSRTIEETMQLKDKHVLVIGSETPWLEAILLSKGAKKVTTLEYKRLHSLHPKLSTVLPHEFDQLYSNGTRFDALVTYSSVEHSGLGRYGDKLNPWGDLITMAKSWCILKPQAQALVGVPSYNDYLVYNMNRRYGLQALPQLFANFKQIFTDLNMLNSQMNEIGLSDSLFVLEKASSIDELFDEDY